MPTHLLTKWNNQEHSEQEWSSNLLYLDDKWNRKLWEDKESKKNQQQQQQKHAPSEVRISCLYSTAHLGFTSKSSQILAKGILSSKKGAWSGFQAFQLCHRDSGAVDDTLGAASAHPPCSSNSEQNTTNS